jgi:FkbM family methyltransferase
MLNFLKPEYLWRPSQIFRRFSFKPSNDVIKLSLPWNCTIGACSAEVIGRAIATQAVYDLPVTEAIMRLADPGDSALDIGANIGYMTLVLARSVGPRGRVTSFEPCPAVLPILRMNVNQWKSLEIAPTEIKEVALSDRDGEGHLGLPADSNENWGVASLEIEEGGIPIKLCRLDSLECRGVGVMKIDVEGHEAAVLSGSQDLLARKLIRDIVFEEHQPYPARSHKILLEHGYRIFRLTRTLWRPLLLPADAPPRQAYLPRNFLATVDSSRADSRFRAPGWYALSNGPLRKNPSAAARRIPTSWAEDHLRFRRKQI